MLIPPWTIFPSSQKDQISSYNLLTQHLEMTETVKWKDRWGQFLQRRVKENGGVCLKYTGSFQKLAKLARASREFLNEACW